MISWVSFVACRSYIACRMISWVSFVACRSYIACRMLSWVSYSCEGTCLRPIMS